MNQEQEFIYFYVRNGVEFATPSLELAYKRAENGAVFEKLIIK